MKTLFTFLTVALLFTAFTPPAQAQQGVSTDFFYDNLEPYGNWLEVGNYGYCWQPRDVGSGWRPYSDGRWVYTDAGWTWDSNEPFGWAVYHYGRWVNLNQIGWIWVPGTEWGPGWVSWRRSPQYVGWAPLPPEALFLRALGLSGWVDAYYDIGPSNYRFVDNRNFGARRLNSVFIDQRQNISIINQTTNITNITYVNNVVHNGGLVYDQQSRQSSEPIQRYKLERRQEFAGDPRNQSADQLRSRINGDSLSVLALPFTGRSSSAPKKLADRIGDAEVNRGWKNAGSPAEVAEMRAKLKSQDKVPDGLPPQPKFELPEGRTPRDPRTPDVRRPDERLPMPKEQPFNPDAKRDDKPSRPDMQPSAPGRETKPGENPRNPELRRPDMPRPDERLPMPREQPFNPKAKRDNRPGRPDMPPAIPEKTTNPADRPPTTGDAPKGDRGQTPAPTDRPPFTKPNPGGRNKLEVPQLPRTEDRPPATVSPKGRDRERMPQISPREPLPVQPIPAPKPPQVSRPAPPVVQAPPAAIPPKPDKVRGDAKPGERKKKKDD